MGDRAGPGLKDIEARRPLYARRLQDFHDLMHHRIMDILLVCSPYDLFILEEAGQINELVYGEFRNLDLHYSPSMLRVSTGAEALDRLSQRRFDLVITTLHVGDMNAAELADRIADAGWHLPVVLLAYDNRELKDFQASRDTGRIDRAFVWHGDARILLAIVKYVEDQLNVAHDTSAVGVQVIVLIEDSVRYYSSFLPLIYTELLHQAQRLIREGVNVSQKIMRMRARPKILLCGTFEEAQAVFSAYRRDVLGIISDIEFEHGGRRQAEAGVEFARMVAEEEPDIPIMLQSSNPENEARARAVGAGFLLKGSPFLLQRLRSFMLESFGFGDFEFKSPEGRVLDRARDLRDLEEKLATIPAESLAYHSERNHFSRWLKARTEFGLAHELRPQKVSDYESIEALRQSVIRAIREYRTDRTLSAVADFDRETFDGSEDFYRIGGGSLGGKARGLAFARLLIGVGRLRTRHPGVRVSVPRSAVLGTDAFDRFLDENGLRDFALQTEDDEEIVRRFLAAPFPADLRRDLAVYSAPLTFPVAVRSSSLLEDSRYLPFTGVYSTYMLASGDPDPEQRLEELLRAIKLVYASTFSARSRAYVRATPYRLEEEKMAVIVQRLVGTRRGSRFYPSFAGVARSHNFYPVPPLAASDGIAAVALGFGRAVVEGQNCLRFSPLRPQHVIQLSSVEDALRNAQREFWALELDESVSGLRERRFGLEVAEADGTLAPLASTYSHENRALYDGISRPGARVVTFAPILKQHTFPLAEVLEELLESCRNGMAAPVEIEFAVDLTPDADGVRDFGFLQMRPLALNRELEQLELEPVEESRLLCRSAAVLGHGRFEGLSDVVVVDSKRFERSRSRGVAAEVARLNSELSAAGRPYLLVGVGRWGSSDPWLGIPVGWEQIAGARVIVEAGFADFKVTPSQGSHFFQNLTSFAVGYFTVNPEAGEGILDWDWLAAQPASSERDGVRHLRLGKPLLAQINGTRSEGVILKPEA